MAKPPSRTKQTGEFFQTKPTRTPPKRSEHNTQISISLNKADKAAIDENRKTIGLTRSAYVTLAATRPHELVDLLFRGDESKLAPGIALASTDYQAALSRDKDRLLLASKKDHFQTVQFPYSTFDNGLQTLQREIRFKANKLRSLGIPKSLVIPTQIARERDFDVIRRTGLVYNQILYLFPFLLTQTRRPFWGVIPYALHRRIGIYFSTDCEAWKSWCEISEEDKLNRSEGMPPEVLGWFRGRFLEHFSDSATKRKEKPRLWVAEGFLHQEILQLLLGEYGSDDITSTFDQFVFPVHRNSFHEQGIPPLESDRQDVLLFDLTEKPALKERGTGFIAEVPHGLSIPVGIGFTLAMFPNLNRDENWDHLLEAAKSVLNTPDYERAFKEFGMELTLA